MPADDRDAPADDQPRPPADDDLVVLRCGACGDTFPASTGSRACSKCGSRHVHVASEPLL
jgi:hypothetical protein